MTLTRFVMRDLLRNPRRTLASLVGVVVGVGLFSAVLFFIDGSGASMTGVQSLRCRSTSSAFSRRRSAAASDSSGR